MDSASPPSRPSSLGIFASTADGSLVRRLAQGAGLTFFIQVAGMGVGYVQRVLFARWLGVDEFGVFAFALALATLLALPALHGWSHAVVRLLPEFTAHERWEEFRGVVRGSTNSVLAVGLLVCLCGTALLWSPAFRDWTYAPATRVAVWLIPALGLAGLYSAMARGVHRMGLAHTPTALARPVLVLALAGIAVAVGTPLRADLVIAITAVVTFVLLLVQRHGFYAGLPAQIRDATPRYEMRGWLAIALPLSIAEAAQTLMMQVDIVMLGILAGPTEAGVYSAVSRTVGLLALIIIAVNAAAAPLFSSVWASGNREAIAPLLLSAARWSFWPSVAMGAVLIWLADPILGWFGPDFRGVRAEVAILTAGRVANLAFGTVMALMSVAGHQRDCARVLAWTAGGNIVLNAMLIPPLGLTGAAIATAASTIGWKLWLHRIAVRRLGLRFSAFARSVPRGANA